MLSALLYGVVLADGFPGFPEKISEGKAQRRPK
jgi:hypothetical protein